MGQQPPMQQGFARESTTRVDRLLGAAFSTPLGLVAAIASSDGIREIGFDLDVLVSVRQDPSPVLSALQVWLDAYFHKQFERLPEVPLDLQGSTLDLATWEALGAVGPGRTITYGDLALKVGRTGQARAVGAAVGRNPALLVVPCHRAVAASGALTGYSAGLERKAWLLRHEGVLML